MLASTFALLVRSWRVDARSLQPHLVRFAFALLIYGWMLVTLMKANFVGAPGLRLFSSICYFNVVLITAAAASWFATAITEEKDEQTLGLLTMTGMSPLALLLGKASSRAITGMLVLFVQFPFTLLSITLGGVTLEQVTAAYAALVAYLALAANLGLLISVASPTSRMASVRAVVLLAIYLYGLGAASWLFPASMSPLVNPWERASVLWRLAEILSSGFRGSALELFQFFGSLGAGSVCFAIAWWRFEFFTRGAGPTTTAVATWKTWRPAHGRVSDDIAVWDDLPLVSPYPSGRSLLVSVRAFRWKSFNFVAGGRWLLLLKCLFYAIVLSAIGLHSRNLYAQGESAALKDFGDWTMWIVLLAFLIESMILAVRFLSDEVRDQTLPLLGLLPTSWSAICRSTVFGSLVTLLPAFSCFILGACCDPKVFGLIVWELFFAKAFVGWLLLTLFLMALHVAAYLSLMIKWGAIPVALLTMVLEFMALVSYALGRSVDDVTVALLAYSLVAANVWCMFILQRRIVRRLEKLAAS